MKLQTKFILALLSSILVVLIAAQTTQYSLNRSALAKLSDDNLHLLETREEAQVRNIYQTIDPVVQEAITLGEMTKLDKLIANYAGIEGLLDRRFTIRKGSPRFRRAAKFCTPKRGFRPR